MLLPLYALDRTALISHHDDIGTLEVVRRPQVAVVKLRVLQLRRLYHADSAEAIVQHLSFLIDDLLRINVNQIADIESLVAAAVQI